MTSIFLSGVKNVYFMSASVIYFSAPCDDMTAMTFTGGQVMQILISIMWE